MTDFLYKVFRIGGEIMFFNKKAGFYSSNLDFYIEQIRSNELRYLPWIFCVFAEDSCRHKLIAAKVLNEVLHTFSFDDLYRTDKQMRETTSMEWRIDWHSLNIKHFILKQMSDDEKCAVLIFATFNPNGYIREQALQSLVRYQNILPFILLRCNDWVYQVRQLALDMLPVILSNANNREIVIALPLMEKLRRSNRCTYNRIFPVMVNTLLSNDQLIKLGLASKDIRARRFCISILHGLEKNDNTYLLNHLPHEQDPLLRKMIFQILQKTNVNIIELSKQFLNDKYPPNRMLALQFLYDHNNNIAFDISVKMLMDKNAKVRALARSIVLEKEATFDIRQFYYHNLNTNASISLYGLGEVGFPEDCFHIEKFLSDNRISVIRAALTALMRLDSEMYVSCITEMLTAKHAGVVKTAAMLLKESNGYDFERIFQIQDKSCIETTKIKCATLLFSSSKWKSLIYTLTIIGSGYEKLDILCQTQVTSTK